MPLSLEACVYLACYVRRAAKSLVDEVAEYLSVATGCVSQGIAKE